MRASPWTKEAIEARFREFLGDDGEDSREARKRRAILAAGYQLFLQQGYRKTTIDEVARKAHVAKGTVYLYFQSKAELLVHSVALEKRVLVARLAEVMSPARPERERLRAYLAMTFESVRELPLVSRLLTGDMEIWSAFEEYGQARVDQSTAEGRAFVEALIEQAAPGALTPEERALRADVILAMAYVSASFLDPRVRQGRSFEELTGALADVLAAGAVTPPPRGAGG